MKKIIAIMLAVMMIASVPTAWAAVEGWPMKPNCPEATPPTPLIEAPRLTITNNHKTGCPYLKWNKVDGAVRYEVYLMSDRTCEFELIFTTKGDHMTHSSAWPSHTYTYLVQSIDRKGVGHSSNVAKRTCDLRRPSFELEGGNDRPPYLSWDYSEGQKGMQVWCSKDGQGYKLLYTASATLDHLRHGSAQVGHTYKYRIRALGRKSAANSAYSYTKTVTVQ